MAKRSIHWADVTVAPSEAFAAELRRWSGLPVRAIHHGFDPVTFSCDASRLSTEVEEKLRTADGSLKLLFVSHYNYYRNFETLLRALPYLRKRFAGRSVKLLLTCKLLAYEDHGAYNSEAAAKLVKELEISDMMLELGAIPYSQLHHLYRQADVYVTPAYTETFAHPLVEAMASGLPIVASDLEVHREICGDAAVYFPRFCADALAECLSRVARPETSRQMAAVGRERSSRFSWQAHLDKILEISGNLMNSRHP